MSKNSKLPDEPMDHDPHYWTGTNHDNAIYGDKKGYSVLGELFDRGLHRQAEQTDYYKKIVEKRYKYLREYNEGADTDFLGNGGNYVPGGSSSGMEKAVDDMAEALKKDGTDIKDAFKKFTGQMLEMQKEAYEQGRKQRQDSSGESGSASEGTPSKKGKKNNSNSTRIDSWGESINSQQKHMRTGEAVLAVAMQQLIDVAKSIEKEVKDGRHKAAELYEQNASQVLSRGVTDKKSYMLETADINNTLKQNDLFANLNTNEIYKGYTELIKKGYSDTDAEEMAMEDAIEAKIAPYLDTSSTAFKDLQNKFGDQFINKISGINNYIQEIAGSAKVWEANANTIISSLEPIQLWAEQQNWGEEEMAALEYLVEEGGMTQTQASQLIQSALKVSTDQYGSITGGTVSQKVAVATGQTDFGDALSSLLTSAGIVSNSNQLVQGAGLNAMGASSYISENADIGKIQSLYNTGLKQAKGSDTTAEDETISLLQQLTSGALTTTSEAETNISQNTGSTFAILEEMFPTVTKTLDKMLGVDTLIEVTTSAIAIMQARQLGSNIVSKIAGSVGNGGGGIISGLKGLVTGGGAATAATGALATGGVALLGTAALIGGIIGLEKLAANSESKSLGDVNLNATPSYDVGSDYIMNDQLAYIHKGEAVLTPEENKEYQTNKKASQKITQQQIQVQVEQEEKNDKLIAEVSKFKTEVLAYIKKYCQQEKQYYYDSDTVNLTNGAETTTK